MIDPTTWKPGQTIDTTGMTEEERMELGRRILRARGVRQPSGLVAPPTVNSKQMQMAAMWLLGASYGQIMSLFKVSKGTAHEATRRQIAIEDIQARPHAQSRPLIANEMASVYFNKIYEIGQMPDAKTLAWAIQDKATASEREVASDKLDP